MYQYFAPFYSWVIFHCMDSPDILYIHSSVGLFLLFGNNEQCCEHSCTSFWVDGHAFISLGWVTTGVELLGHMGTPCLPFWQTARLFSTAAAPFYISHTTNNVRVLLSLHPRPHLTVCIFDYSHLVWNGTSLRFQFAFARWIIFLPAHWPFTCLWRNVFAHFVFLLLSFFERTEKGGRQEFQRQQERSGSDWDLVSQL